MKTNKQVAGLFVEKNAWRYTKEDGKTDYIEPFGFRDWLGSIFVHFGLWIASFKVK